MYKKVTASIIKYYPHFEDKEPHVGQVNDYPNATSRFGEEAGDVYSCQHLVEEIEVQKENAEKYEDVTSDTDYDENEEDTNDMEWDEETPLDLRILPEGFEENDTIKTIKKQPRVTKDERLANNLGIDKYLTVKEIVNLDLNVLKEKVLSFRAADMTKKQEAEIWKIRKKGKNKNAAQNCRQQKTDQINLLKKRLAIREEVLRVTKTQTQDLMEEYSHWTTKLNILKHKVLTYHNFDPAHWEIVIIDGEIRFDPSKSTTGNRREM